MKKEQILQIVFLCISIILTCSVHAEIQESEKEAIQMIIDSADIHFPPIEEICDLDIIICDGPHITALFLNETGLERLPPEISQLTQITRLDLSENKLEELPENIGVLENLTELNLYMNKLKTLPESFGQLVHLTYLNLGDNQLGDSVPDLPQKRQLPPGPIQEPPLPQLHQLTRLNTLIMDNNRLKHIPFNLSSMICLETLSLNDNLLTEFPSTKENLSKLKSLYLSQNDIVSFPENMNLFSSLQNLDLSHNKLDNIPDSIGQLKALISLYLTGNKIESVSPEIGALTGLQNLSLAENNLSALPDSISHLELLINLSLEENALVSLPESVGKWTDLVSLSLNSNQLEALPDDFGSLVSLVTLNVKDNLLRALPDSFGQLRNLERLTLSNNDLKVLPDNFYELGNLLFLDASQNKLSQLPEQFSQLKSLQTLNLTSNLIHSLPSDFGSLSNLRYLYASSNAFGGTLAESVGHLQSIQEIDFSNNKIDTLPPTFGNLDTLQTLNLSSNNLEALPYSFGELDNLQIVDLSTNKIKDLKADFGDLSFLSHLYLSNNKLEYLPPQMGELNSLTYLDLSHNEIVEIPESMGEKLERMFTLNLSYNNLKHLPPEFGAMKNLRTLLLNNNAFTQFPDIILLLTDLLLLDLSNNPNLTGHIPFNFLNLNDLTDLKLNNTSLVTDSQLMADFINDHCRACNFSPTTPTTITIDGNELFLEGITSPTDELKYFKAGEDIDIVLMFNEPVQLEGGELIVTFNTGYTSSISTLNTYVNAITLKYTIHAGDDTEALNVSQVSLTGGTLTDKNGNHAVLDLPVDNVLGIDANLASNKILPIDGVYPTVSITQPDNEQCVDVLDKIKGTADDNFGVKEIEITVSNDTQTTKPAIHEIIINEDHSKEWVVDVSKMEWQTDQEENQEDEYLLPDNLLPEPFELEENVTYTITVKVVDNVENESITRTTFTYKKQTSEISCHLSDSQIIIGESLTITGVIFPTDSSIPDIRIEMTSENGIVTTKKISANRDGSFSYLTECTDFDYAGLWYIKAIFDGGECISESESASQSLSIAKAETELVLSTTEDAIRKNDLFSISGTLTPSPYCGASLSGLVLSLYFNGPSHLKPLIVDATINTDYGLFLKKDFQLSEQYQDDDITGRWTVSAYFPETNIYQSSTSQIMSVNVLDSAGYAIIVQGKISNGEGLASHQKTSDFVYKQFLNRGLNDQNDNDSLNDIQYFSYAAPGESGYTYIDHAPSKDLVEDAITVWAKKKMNAYPGPLYIVMVDHGLENKFLMDDAHITSSELASWLDNLQDGLSGPAKGKGIVTILGFCHSGSFIDELSGAYRIIITSAAENEYSYKGPLDQDNIREGEYFISEFFKKVVLGKNIRTCFEEASILTEKFTADLSGKSANAPPYYDNSPQHPLLDDNADGVGSNSLDSTNSDGFFSFNHIIGVSSMSTNAGTDVSIDDVTETLFLAHDETPSDPLFWAQVSRHETLLHLWLEIKSPSYTINQSSESGQKEMDLKKISTADLNSSLNRYEWQGSEDLYDYFNEPGIYQIFYFAQDKNSLNVSAFKDSIVYKNKPDNQPPAPFSLISPQDDLQISTKGIIFNCTNDSNTNCYTVFSWEETWDPDNDHITYTLVLSKGDETFSDPVKHEMLQNNAMSIDLPDKWEGTDIYWKVQAIDQYGAIQETPVYHFSTISVTNPDTGIIKGYVYDSFTKNPIYRAKVNLDNSMMRTSSRGYYHGSVEPKIYDTISIVADDYKTQYLYSVHISNGEILEQNITLEPESSDVTGDINGDYAVDLFDLIAGIQILADTVSEKTINLFADADRDDHIGMAEVIYIIKKISNQD
jgi:Leucine-rich repeat (LRR) protein